MMGAATFFGHRDCPHTVKPALREAIMELIHKHNVTMFYVGDSGQYDAYCRSVLKEIGANYAVVLSRMPGKPTEYDDFSDTMLPEGIVEGGPPRFAIERRNKWMIEQSDFVICYLRHRMYGGAAKFASLAEKKGKNVINIYNAD